MDISGQEWTRVDKNLRLAMSLFAGLWTYINLPTSNFNGILRFAMRHFVFIVLEAVDNL